jgi:hypothetical protein
MSAHNGRGIGNAIVRDLKAHGHARTELEGRRPGSPRYARDTGRVWVSHASPIWAEIFEVGDRVYEEMRRLG